MTEGTPRCNATTKSGEQCKAYPHKDGKCYYHADPDTPRRLQVLALESRERNIAEKRRQEQERAMSLQEALLRRAADERDSLVNALFAPLSGDDRDAHRAAVAILERLLGRPTQEMTVNTSNQPMELEDLVALWAQEQAH